MQVRLSPHPLLQWTHGKQITPLFVKQPLSESKPSGTGEQDSLYFRVRITMGVSSVVETTVTQLIASVWRDYFLHNPIHL